MIPRRTLVAPGYQPYILVDKPSAYADRYDFIGAINGSQPIACTTLTPTERQRRNIKGVTKFIVNEWIINELAPAIGRLGLTSVYVICDKSRAHQRLAMLEAFKAGRCREVVDVLFMPTASAKYLSPLDNPLWHSFKEIVRKQHPLQANDIPESLSNTFFSLSTNEIRNAYRKCAITAKSDVHRDQPFT